MEAELEDKIKEIGSAFGIENMPDNIGEIISAFLNSDASDNDSFQCNDNEASAVNEACCDNSIKTDCNGIGSILGNGTDILRIISGVQAMKHQNENDYKIIFLKNLKPLLSREKQSRVDKCVNFLCFAKVVEMYGQNG